MFIKVHLPGRREKIFVIYKEHVVGRYVGNVIFVKSTSFGDAMSNNNVTHIYKE